MPFPSSFCASARARRAIREASRRLTSKGRDGHTDRANGYTMRDAPPYHALGFVELVSGVILCFLCFGALDLLLRATLAPATWRSVRWFTIHATANAAISACSWAGLVGSLKDPLHSNNSEWWPAPPLV